jgi:3alpha(or 20beta)-hydroxysteroid dehydrogenase
VLNATEARFGGVDILVNNAAIGDIISFADLTEETYRRFININQVSVFLSLKAIVPAMQKRGGGSIVNISSVAGLVASVGNFAYTASKFAVRGMTKSAALEFATQNIRVNSVHPGAIRTPMFDASGTMDEHIKALVPMGRVAGPEEVSGLVLFLASDESSYCTGGEFVVDGGYTMV